MPPGPGKHCFFGYWQDWKTRTMDRCFFRNEIKINGRCRNTGLKSRFFPSVLRFRKEASIRIGGCRSISGNEAINTLIPHGSSHGSRCSNFQPILPVNRLRNSQGEKDSWPHFCGCSSLIPICFSWMNLPQPWTSQNRRRWKNF